MKLDKKSLLREKKLKKIPFNKMTKWDIKFLEEQGVINGIWPESYWKGLRWLMTKLFYFVNYKRHDVWFWQQIWFHYANWGLLKYSHISLAKQYEIICKDKWYRKLYQVPLYHITLPFKSWVIGWAYNAVESKAWKEAYDLSKKS